MAFVSLKCPNCNGDIQMDNTKEKGFCMYCGSSFLVKDEVQRMQIEHSGTVNLNLNREKEVENLLIRAEQKIEKLNEEYRNKQYDTKLIQTYESIMEDYIEKALDIEPNFPKTLELKQRLISMQKQKVNEGNKVAANHTRLCLSIIALVIFLAFFQACFHLKIPT